ncbi:MAG: hypothetical protein AAF533_24165 [Acidobacteriota bacterium]
MKKVLEEVEWHADRPDEAHLLTLAEARHKIQVGGPLVLTW